MSNGLQNQIKKIFKKIFKKKINEKPGFKRSIFDEMASSSCDLTDEPTWLMLEEVLKKTIKINFSYV